MTPQERAEKMTPCRQPGIENCVCPMCVLRPLIAAQIAEACEEAEREALHPYENYTLPNGDEVNLLTEAMPLLNRSYSEGYAQGFTDAKTKFYSEGFLAAQEMAAKIVMDYFVSGIKMDGRSLPEQIRAMRDEGDK